MKKPIAVLLIIWICLFLGGCGSTRAEGDSVSENVSAGVQSQPTAVSPSENDDTDYPDEYVMSYPISVENSRKLTLKLCGKKLREEYEQYGIRTIEVLDGSDLIQTIHTQEAISSVWDGNDGMTDSYGGYTEAFGPDGGLTTMDMNFDGSGDIGLMGWIANNIPYYYWLWDEEQGKFTYAFYLCNAVVDEKNQQLVSEMKSGAEYSTDYYQYDKDGHLQNVKRIVETYGGPTVITETYELVNGELQRVK